jgi:putative ABC transport system substrate-binding protein
MPGLAERVAGAEAAAKSLGIELQRIDAATPGELTAAFAAIAASPSEALLIQNDPMLGGTEGQRLYDFAITHRLATVIEGDKGVATGALLSYGPDFDENYRLAAGYVDKILRGAKPSDLPVQQPTKFLLRLNLKTASAIGLAVPQSIIARADEVIE